MSANGGGPVVVLLSSGENTLVSLCDLGLVESSRWRLGKNGYVYKRGHRAAGKPMLLHRIPCNAGPGQEVHHKDGIKTNNTRGNLEVTTASLHQEHHKHHLISRNKRARIHPSGGVCRQCQRPFISDPNHRGRQVVCGKACAIKAAVAARRISCA